MPTREQELLSGLLGSFQETSAGAAKGVANAEELISKDQFEQEEGIDEWLKKYMAKKEIDISYESDKPAKEVIPDRRSNQLIDVDATMSKLIKQSSNEDVPEGSVITVAAYTKYLKPEEPIKPVVVKPQTTADKKFEVEQKEKTEKTAMSEELIKTSAQDTLNTIAEIKNGINNFGAKAQFIPKELAPGTPYYNWKTNLDKLLATKIVDLMATMKNASKTGATGFGQLSEKELAVLQGASTALKAGLSPKDAMKYLNDMERMYNKILQGGSNTGVKLPSGLSEEDINYNIKKYGVTRQQVIDKHLGR